jgi:hypothetical protein
MSEEQILNIIIYSLLALVIGIHLINTIRIQVGAYRQRRLPVLTAPAEAWYKHPGMEPVLIGRHSTYLFHITFRTEDGLEMKLYMNRDVYFIIPEGAKGDLVWQGDRLIKFTFEDTGKTVQ